MKKNRKQRLVIWAAKGMFKSARKLADSLKPHTDKKILIVRSDSPRFHQRLSDIIINWGNSLLPNWELKDNYLNSPVYIGISVNKLKTFQALTGLVRIPDWTNMGEQAQGWVNEGHTVLCRTVLTGFGGDGIHITTKGEQVIDAPLYVLYKKKKAEYRVHVFNGKIIDITQKKKRAGFEDVDTKIRNYANGWVYCREDIEVPDDVCEQAVKAVRHLGLTFGAVDIIYNEKEDQAYVLEINSAPGLEGTTIEAYKNAILIEINK